MDEATPDLAELVAEVRRIDVSSRRLVTEFLAGGYLSVFRGRGLEIDEVREYADGDDPRAVDWNVTARMGRPFVKVFAEEREQTLLFVLDLSGSMAGGFSGWSLRQTAARVVAALALAAARHDDQVGLLAGAGTGLTLVPAAKGVGHVLRIVRDALALPARGEGALPRLLERLRQGERRRVVAFVLSDFLEGGWRTPLALAARRHDVVAVRLSPPEVVLPDAGLLRVADPETGAVTRVDTSSQRVREAFAARVAAHRAAADEAFTAARVDVLDVPVPRTPRPDAVVGPLLRFFRMRELRGRKA